MASLALSAVDSADHTLTALKCKWNSTPGLLRWLQLVSSTLDQCVPNQTSQIQDVLMSMSHNGKTCGVKILEKIRIFIVSTSGLSLVTFWAVLHLLHWQS
jgi:hypothetical protein